VTRDDASHVGRRALSSVVLDARRPRLPPAASTISTKCGAANGAGVGAKVSRSSSASAESSAASAPSAAMRRSTVCCRARADSGLRNGLKLLGRCGRPARKAACAGVSIAAGTPK
jgi:hypothetical protein